MSQIIEEIRNRVKFVLRPMPISEACVIALASSNTAMLLVLDTFTQYIGLDLSTELTALKAQSHVDPDATEGQ